MGKTEVTQQQWHAVMGTPMRTVCGDIAITRVIPGGQALCEELEGAN